MNDIKQLILPDDTADQPADDDTDRVTLQSDHGLDVESVRNYAEEVYW